MRIGVPATNLRYDYHRLFRPLRWATIIFVAATIQLPTSHVYIKWAVYVVLAVAVGFDLAWNYLLAKPLGKSQVLTETILDIIWITFLQLPTGQIHSPFYFLYALPILNSALLLERRGVHLVGAVSAIVLVPVLFLHLWKAPLDLNHFFSYFVRFGLIFICTFLGGLLALQRER